MSSVVIAGNTSGSITLQAPAVSGSTVLTLPTTSATLITDSSGILNIGSGQVYKDASGNVGIGTSSPSTWGKFAVVGASSGGQVVASIANTSGTANTQAVLSFDTTNNGFNVRDSQIRATNSGGNLTTLEFYTANATTPAERMRIDSSGNVGIGVTPSAWSGGYNALEFLSGSIAFNNNTQLRIYQNCYYNGSNLVYKNTGAVSSYQLSAGAHIWYQAASGTAGATLSLTPAMTLDTNGNLGIGTSSPSARLQSNVSGVGSVTALNLTNENNGAAAGTGAAINFGVFTTSLGAFGKIEVLNQTAGTGSDSYMAFSTRGGDSLLPRMRIDSSGNVLVGTTIPSGKLTVNGGIYCSSGFVSDTILTDTTLTTYTAGTYYTLPGTVPLSNSATYLISIVLTYDSFTYHNWCGGGIISLTYWKASGTETTWTIPMDTHTDGVQSITIKSVTSQNGRVLSWTPSTSKTVTTGGSIVVRLKLISGF